jgi:hypothetical protein
VGAVRAHHPDFNQAEVAQNYPNPGDQQPGIDLRDSNSAENERQRGDRQELHQVLTVKMTFQLILHWTSLAIC